MSNLYVVQVKLIWLYVNYNWKFKNIFLKITEAESFVLCLYLELWLSYSIFGIIDSNFSHKEASICSCYVNCIKCINQLTYLKKIQLEESSIFLTRTYKIHCNQWEEYHCSLFSTGCRILSFKSCSKYNMKMNYFYKTLLMTGILKIRNI